MMVDWPNLAEKKQAFKFPSVAADLLSTPNQKVVDFFTGAKSNGGFGRTLILLMFFVDSNKEGPARYNYTRSGYVSKVLNSLILHRGGAVARHILLEGSLGHMVEACHCKSASSTVLNLITLLASSVMTPLMMATAPGLLENKVEMAVSSVAPDVVNDTQPKRLELFKEVLTKAIETADSESTAELHANLVWIVSQILVRQSAERPLFLKIFNETLPRVVAAFVDGFGNLVNNRLGNLFLVALETQSKDQQQQNAAAQAAASSAPPNQYCLPNLPQHMASMVRALVSSFENRQISVAGSKMTHSFSSESGRLNPKVYKVIEALNVGLRFYHADAEFVSKTLLETQLQRFVFRLLSDNSFNNILHNQVKKLLMIVIEKCPAHVVDAYFANNEAFLAFIDRMAATVFVQPAAVRKIRHGFIGQTVAICTALRAAKTPGNTRLFEGAVTRCQLEGVHGQVLRAGVRAGVAGAGGHRLPRGQPGQLPALLRLHHRRNPAALPGVPALRHRARRRHPARRGRVRGGPGGRGGAAGGTGDQGNRRQPETRGGGAAAGLHRGGLLRPQLLEAVRGLQHGRVAERD